MEILILALVLMALDVLALRFGADSRIGIERDAKVTGILR